MLYTYSMNNVIIAFALVTKTFNLPAGLLPALCYVESNHRVNAVHYHDGGANSLGICQIKLDTAKLVGFKGTELQLQNDYFMNIYYSGKYLNWQLNRYNWNVEKAVAAYNAGKCRVNKKGLIMNRKYVTKVMYTWEQPK